MDRSAEDMNPKITMGITLTLITLAFLAPQTVQALENPAVNAPIQSVPSPTILILILAGCVIVPVAIFCNWRHLETLIGKRKTRATKSGNS
jgi:hypothetical protein